MLYMMAATWLRTMRHMWAGHPRGGVARTPGLEPRSGAVAAGRSIRLNWEELEDRCVPAIFLWAPPGEDLMWSNPVNWRVATGGKWAPAAATPGVTDQVLFRANIEDIPESDSTCTIDVNANVLSVRIDQGYSAPVQVAKTITIQNMLTLDAISAAIQGNSTSSVVLSPGSEFQWNSGGIIGCKDSDPT
jgi:hypothetical protein